MGKTTIFALIEKLNTIDLPKDISKSNIIFYNISQDGEFPLMQILMQKTMGEYHFPNFPLLFKDDEDLIIKMKIFGKKCLETLIVDNFDLNLFEFKGWQRYNNETFFFINISLIEITNSYMTSLDRFNFISIGEIINQESFFFFSIKKINIDYIKYHLSDFLLKNEENENYNVPFIGYRLAEEKISDFINIFGISKQIDKEENYYKINLNINSVFLEKKKFDQNIPLSINRIALFVNSLKIVDNDNLINEELIRHDGILFNNVETEESFLIFKHFSQQIPLCSFKLR